MGKKFGAWIFCPLAILSNAEKDPIQFASLNLQLYGLVKILFDYPIALHYKCFLHVDKMSTWQNGKGRE